MQSNKMSLMVSFSSIHSRKIGFWQQSNLAYGTKINNKKIQRSNIPLDKNSVPSVPDVYVFLICKKQVDLLTPY